MKQWEIYDFPYPSPEQAHPFVILSPTVLAESGQYEQVNALMCVSLRGKDQPKLRDVRLNGSDGLDGPPLVRCHFVFTLPKSAFGRKRGDVSAVRRREIPRTLGKCFGFAGF